LIIFTHARQIRDYHIDSVIRYSNSVRADGPVREPARAT